MDPLFEIALDMPPKGSRESGRALHGELVAAIRDGRLRSGARMPATRKAKGVFGVSRNTAAEVYERLLNEGYLTARHGSGTFVAETLPAPPEPPALSRDGVPERRLNSFWLRAETTGAMGFWRDGSGSQAVPIVADFRPALIDSRLFPFDTYRRISAKQLRGLEQRPASFKSPQGNQGNHFLRRAITQHIALTRAVVCRPDDILVASGAQQAFDLLARVLVTAEKTVVAIEDPGYPPMRVAFAAAGARLVPVPVDDEGLVVDRLPPDVGVICVSPSHQFPLGVSMSARRRQALIEFAQARGAVIVEDDYDGEFHHEGHPLKALRTAEAADVVFYVGTFSKCMLPALRLGFVVAPDWAMPALTAAKNCLDWHCPIPVQLGVSGFIAEGHLARHVRKMRQLYRQRRQRLLTRLHKDLGPWLEPIPSFYGMHVAALARAPIDLESVVEALLGVGVKIHTLNRYFLDAPTQTGLVFGYGAVDTHGIDQGLSLLRDVLRTATPA
jgi:GntR family transcriptional regulator / MocR family aminotransferase